MIAFNPASWMSNYSPLRKIETRILKVRPLYQYMAFGIL